jgi:hypothetical protein
MICVAVYVGSCVGLLGATASANDPQVAAANARGIYAFDIAVGNRGYAVMAWSVKAGNSVRGRYRANVFIRTRLPGRAQFGPKRFVGKASSDFVATEIGGNGTTVVAWSGTGGLLTYLVRTPRLRWDRPKTVAGADVTSARLSIASDGTVAMASLRNASATELPGRVLGTVWRGRTEVRHRWRVLSTNEESIGFRLAVLAEPGGRGTVVWSGPCRRGESKVASSWVAMNLKRSTVARKIKGSGCVAWDIDLQADRYGNQYLRLGLLAGVQMAIRKAGRRFAPADRIGPAGFGAGGGYLSVSENGLATLILGSTRQEQVLLYITSRKGGAWSEPRQLDNIRSDYAERRDALLQVAPLPGGRLAMFWAEIWPPGDGRGWRGLAMEAWHPNSVFEIPEYREIPAGYVPFPKGLATGSRGDSIAWWNLTPETDDIGNRVYWSEL